MKMIGCSWRACTANAEAGSVFVRALASSHLLAPEAVLVDGRRGRERTFDAARPIEEELHPVLRSPRCLLGAAVLLVAAAAILIGYFFVQPKPHFGESRLEEIVVVYREAGDAAAPKDWTRGASPILGAFRG